MCRRGSGRVRLADGSGARRFRRVEQRWALPQLVCREHRLVVLLFVLRDHREDETLAGQLVVECTVFEHIPGEIADSTRVTASGVGVEQRQPCAGRAGMPERVVEIVDVAADRRRLPATRTSQRSSWLAICARSHTSGSSTANAVR